MSTAVRIPAPERAGKARKEPRLIVIHGAPFRPPRMPFVLFVLAVLGGGLVGLLLLNTELQRGTFEITALSKQADGLRDQQEALERDVRALESPQNLSGRALKMGMVPNPNPVFLRLSDGKVLGVPEEGKAGTGTAMFAPTTPPQARPSTPAVRPSTQPTPTAPTGSPTNRPSTPTGVRPTPTATTTPRSTTPPSTRAIGSPTPRPAAQPTSGTRTTTDGG